VINDFTIAGGIQPVVDILNRVDRGTERTILEALGEADPELADQIKSRMFVF
jgi:flagellar motor switch protein FliG